MRRRRGDHTPISICIQPHLPVETYMLESHAHWMRMGDLIPLVDEDLYFVLGTITTTRWLVGSHLGAFEGMGHICCSIPDVFSDLYRGIIRADDDCRMPTINHGHSPLTPMSNNQCLFVHYAKLKRRPARTGVQWLWYKLRSCFRGHLHTSQASGDHQSWEVLPPSQPPPQDPVDVLLNYILKKQPDADTAIASSLDIVDMFKGSQIPHTKDLKTELAALKPRVDIDYNTHVGRLHVSSQRQDVAVSDKVERAEDSEDKCLTASSSTERPVPSMCM
ncbi:hypothetical protein OH76DRAFT_1560234 [Lentinus brumalis]|uniref:Uncharacterized protein n=1 Tax=Lentinus brumalis TaxID=2498619 RepID=A0A371CTJ2_9APHY|nr:hypothetical protein OH76DRAFT_1560234 [Polyporus brumalis]